jgi:hypothetical protein
MGQLVYPYSMLMVWVGGKKKLKEKLIQGTMCVLGIGLKRSTLCEQVQALRVPAKLGTPRVGVEFRMSEFPPSYQLFRPTNNERYSRRLRRRE